ncbi:hypothetical protein GQ607_010376 [Colletotrichum asianum]|uniref:Uncharacterized protein n=1 Tax=Colletotrichum asianum TaxID=702518 RepID=A0A8H3WA28_9PEZI|nr:hypothetical protein GQ607_010376 [Colletotrichum asianum]
MPQKFQPSALPNPLFPPISPRCRLFRQHQIRTHRTHPLTPEFSLAEKSTDRGAPPPHTPPLCSSI